MNKVNGNFPSWFSATTLILCSVLILPCNCSPWEGIFKKTVCWVDYCPPDTLINSPSWNGMPLLIKHSWFLYFILISCSWTSSSVLYFLHVFSLSYCISYNLFFSLWMHICFKHTAVQPTVKINTYIHIWWSIKCSAFGRSLFFLALISAIGYFKCPFVITQMDIPLTTVSHQC